MRSPPKQPMKLSTTIRVFSIVSVVLGVSSIGLQIATLVLTLNGVSNYGLDYVGAGIWGGAIYIVAGGLGIGASIKRTRPLLIATVVMSCFALASAMTATSLAAINAGDGYYNSCTEYECYYNGDSESWLGTEWSLMGFSVLAMVNSIVLLSVASVPTCCGGKTQPRQAPLQSQQPYQQVIMVNGQPMILQPAAPVVVGGPPMMTTQTAPYSLQQLQPQQLMTLAPVAPAAVPSMTINSDTSTLMTSNNVTPTAPEDSSIEMVFVEQKQPPTDDAPVGSVEQQS